MPGTVVVGNKNYSSWSLRGWLMARLAGLDFAEVVIPLDVDGFKDAILAHSPAGRVPVLKHAGNVIWDSLAIGEYLAKVAPDAGFWPADGGRRAHARSLCAEMHAGFEVLRQHLPMYMRARKLNRSDRPGVAADIERVVAIWQACLANANRGGPYLFGQFGMADAMYAPVVSRFRTYDVALPADCAAYAEAVWSWPAMAEWYAAAEAETWVIEED